MAVGFPTLLPEIWGCIAQYSDITVCRTLSRVSKLFITVVQDQAFNNAWKREVYATIDSGPGFGFLLDFLLEGRGSWREVFLANVVVLRSLTIFPQSYNINGSFHESVLSVAKKTINPLILLEGHFKVDCEGGIEVIDEFERVSEFPGAFETLFLDLTTLDMQLDNPEVSYYLSECYFRGIGTQVNPEKAFAYTLIAAKKRWEPACCNLGVFYAKGFGVKQNYKEAIACLNCLTTPEAKFFLGVIMLADEFNFLFAIDLIEQAALGGHKEAQYLAGLYYLNGYLNDRERYLESDSIGINTDPEKAFKFLQLSAHQGHFEATSKLGDCYLRGFGIEQCFTKGFACLELANRYGAERYCSPEAFLSIKSHDDRLKLWQFLEEGSENGDCGAALSIDFISKELKESDVHVLKKRKLG